MPILVDLSQIAHSVVAVQAGDTLNKGKVGDESAGIVRHVLINSVLQYQNKYKGKYGQESAAPEFVAFGYDAINTLIQAHKISLEKNHINL